MSTPETGLVGKLATQLVGMAFVFVLVLFVPAGTLAWPAGWVFLALFYGFVIALSVWLLRFDPGLLSERMGGFRRRDVKAWDRAFIALTALLFYAWLALMALDAVRFRWSAVPRWLQALGALLLVGSFYLFFLTFRENSYLSPAVRLQAERGHHVVSTGPYRHVRHPMYAAFVLLSVGTALLLGSWYGVLGALVMIAMVARRAVLEERVLRDGLAGYDDYLARVRYRLVPHLW